MSAFNKRGHASYFAGACARYGCCSLELNTGVFWKNYALLTQVRTHTFVSTHTCDAERIMYLKLTMLFLLIGFVAGLPYLFEKYGQFGKRRQAIDITKASGYSSFNHQSAGRGSI